MSAPVVLVAARLGEQGYVAFLHAVARLGVLDRDERLGLLKLHGAVIRASKSTLADDERFDALAFTALVEELGS